MIASRPEFLPVSLPLIEAVKLLGRSVAQSANRLMVTLAGAALLHKLVERPAMACARRIVSARAGDLPGEG